VVLLKEAFLTNLVKIFFMNNFLRIKNISN
jgi:hypothetical protein